MNGADGGIAAFGPFRLSAARRELERNGVPLVLGDRALDILIALVEHAGEIVSHRDLIASAWRGLVVSPGNLRVHMTALRRALGDGEDGARYIANVAGQGYTFVAPVTRTSAPPPPPSQRPTSSAPSSTIAKAHLPPALSRMVGRDETVRTIAADLRTDRFVTIVGPGGMGKTTVAVSVAHAMLDEFAGNVCFVDIGAIADPKLLMSTIASTLELPNRSADAVATLMSFLQTTRMLLLLDNCEHIIDAVASLAEMIFSQAPGVHILATSREALRVEGEHAHWLRPLESPPKDTHVGAAAALTFPAVKLFVDRAAASDVSFELTDRNAPIVADICGRLDGIALAIELVAGRVGTYGLQGTADLLNKRLGLNWQGRRTALPRHQTLNALLDWSYSLLPEFERRVLQRLSIFVGAFTLEAARAIASDVAPDDIGLADAIDHLIGKSLVSTLRRAEGPTTYRLLETTRIYALGKLEASGAADPTSERHARYFIRLLRSAYGGRLSSGSGEGTPVSHEHLGNVRAALEWCFGERAGPPGPRNAELGIELAVASAPASLDFSLWSECHKWSSAALAVLPDSMRGDLRELVLQEAYAISSLFTGASDMQRAIVRGIEIARQLGETEIRLRLLASLHFYSHRVTDFRKSLAVSEEIEAVARTTDDVTYWSIADWLSGSSQMCLGNQTAALQLLERGFSYSAPRYVRKASHLGIYYRTRGLNGLARVQWLCGYPERALQTARQQLAESVDTPAVNQSYGLLIVCHVFLWRGDFDTALEVVEKVMAQPHWQGRLVWFHTEALALQGEVLFRRGNLERGIELLSRALSDMRTKSQKNLMLTVTACALAEALAAAGRLEQALEVIDGALSHAPAGEETWEAPELLRVKASIVLSMPKPNEATVERCLTRAIELSRQGGGRGWELRATMTLARLRSMQRRNAEGRALLQKIYGRFTEGFDTRDLQAARDLLQSLT